MTNLNLNGKGYLLVEVMDKTTVIPVLMGYKSIGHTQDLTEEQAASMVEKTDFDGNIRFGEYGRSTAIQAFKSSFDLME